MDKPLFRTHKSVQNGLECRVRENKHGKDARGKMFEVAAVLSWLHKQTREGDFTFDILRLLDKEGKMNVTELYVNMRVDQSKVSGHLSKLSYLGLVTLTKVGKFHYYSLNRARCKVVFAAIKELAGEDS